ncbi:TetR/AcrR family transcriptional regulator [Promicromonospora sp. MS192]|uniref:TetR/AcrR family transcriptional regulator n=1 Tax=Promicromonospora sp. MS192 TaxID=3412684 RepID=UPI003C2E3379
MEATQTTRRPAAARRRAERAERILAAATELVLRWGYDKTTIDDVARLAGVAKGTIYLHWSSREELFAALMRWDRAQMIGAVRRELRDHPETATLPGLFGHLAREIHRRPLLQAALVQDSAVLGKLVARKRTSTTTPEMVVPFGEYLAALRERGMARADLSVEDHLTVIAAVLHGSLFSVRMMPDSLRVSDERTGELVADMLVRALAPEREPSEADRAVCADATRAFVDRAYAVARAKLRESLGDDLPPDEEETS